MISVSYKGGEEVAAEAFKVEAKAPTDTTPPTLTVDESAVTVNNATYTLTGTAEVGATVTVNGEAVTVAEDGTFSAVVTLVEGANTLTVVAKDAAGNEATATKVVTLDTAAPTLTVDETAVTVNNATYTLTGTTEAGATVTVNGEPVTVAEDGTFSVDVTLVEGANTLIVVAKDAAGNEATASKVVTLELLPVIDAVSAITNAEEKVTINGEVTGGAEKVNVVLKNASGTVVADMSGDNAVAVTEGAFTYTTGVGLAAGTYTYEVSAVKGDQTSAVKTGTVEVKNVLPTVTSVTAVDSTTLQVVFSEPVSKATAEDVANYSVRNLAIDNTPVALVSGTDTAVLSADGKTLTIKIVTAAAKLTNGDYYFIVDQSGTDVADLRGNAVSVNTSFAFKGVSTADTVAPEVLTAKYDAAGGTITINFNEPMDNTAAALDRTKISVSDGTNSVALSTFDSFAWINGNSTLTITLSSTKKSAIAALGANKTLSIAAG